MNIFGLVMFVLMAVVAIVIFAINVRASVSTVKESKVLKVNYFPVVKKMTYLSFAFAVAFTAMLCFIYLWANITPLWHEWLFTILVGSLFAVLLSLSLNYFILHYYGKDIDPKLDKWLFRALAISFPLTFISCLYATNGFANYVNYPLPNALNLFSNWGFSYPGENASGITFYALCILTGAIYVYYLSDPNFYKEYGKHGILESTFFVAFPAGIIGARLFYVIGQWNTEFGWNAMSSLSLFGQNIPVWAPLAVWDGGLTILGGAFTGIVVGVAWFLWRNKGYSIWVAVDLIVPTILIAQAVGRWGNFFNVEVHGVATEMAYWRWLPSFIVNNMHYGQTIGSALSEGQMYVPLFFIEGITNFLGYFVLAHLFGKKLRKYTELGDLAFGYFIWYGLTRAILEPMRDATYIMNDLWSWFWGLAFVGIGALLIIANHFVRHLFALKKGTYFIKENTQKNSIIAIIGIVSAAIVVAIIGVIFMINSDYHLQIRLTNFNIAVLLYVIAGSVLLMSSVPALHLVEAIKKEKGVQDE